RDGGRPHIGARGGRRRGRRGHARRRLRRHPARAPCEPEADQDAVEHGAARLDRGDAAAADAARGRARPGAWRRPFPPVGRARIDRRSFPRRRNHCGCARRRRLMGGALSRRAVLAAGLAGSAAFALGGCRSEGGLTFWAIGNEAAALPGFLPDLGLGGVEVQPLPWSGAHQKLLTGYVGQSLPDLAQVGNSWLAELAALGAIDPVPADLDLAEDQFGAVLASNRIGGRLMAAPWYVDTRVQFYRTDLFARAGYGAPPLDWDE